MKPSQQFVAAVILVKHANALAEFQADKLPPGYAEEFGFAPPPSGFADKYRASAPPRGGELRARTPEVVTPEGPGLGERLLTRISQLGGVMRPVNPNTPPPAIPPLKDSPVGNAFAANLSNFNEAKAAPATTPAPAPSPVAKETPAPVAKVTPAPSPRPSAKRETVKTVRRPATQAAPASLARPGPAALAPQPKKPGFWDRLTTNTGSGSATPHQHQQWSKMR